MALLLRRELAAGQIPKQLPSIDLYSSYHADSADNCMVWIARLPPTNGWYAVGMKNKKPKATQQVRLYPSIYRRLKIQAARLGITMAALIEQKV